ncbi:MAG TPA: hypothetical protein VGE02_10220 [Gemmatimonadales bacterium]
MIELARFHYAGEEWAFAIGHDRQPRLLSSARDRRTYMILWQREVGRVVPVRCATQARGRSPWEGWYCCLVLMGEEDQRQLWYPEWVRASVGTPAPLGETILDVGPGAEESP